MNKGVRILLLLVCVAALFPVVSAGAKTSVVFSKHNLSKTGPGTIKALVEDRICVFCHAPHNANPLSPLWNKNIQGINYALYTTYTSSTMRSPASAAGPTGATRLCLSCHDGTIALGQILQPGEKIAMTVTGGIPAWRPSNFGTSLANHHPVSFSYYNSLPNPELSPVLPAELLFYENGTVQCSTCHDAHDDMNKKFLRVNNSGSRLCKLCHVMNGWETSSHAVKSNTWNLTPPDPWPRTGSSSDFGWVTVQQNGCENCHAPHNAGGQMQLLNYREEEMNCSPCHNGSVAAKNVWAQFHKPSRHRVEITTIGVTVNHHDDRELPSLVAGHVECVDCHNPHVANDLSSAFPPAVSGRLQNVSGVDSNGVGIVPPNYSTNEYEICFKCHANPSAQTMFPPIPRVLKDANTRLAFQTTNPSYHPVVGMGKNLDIPSIPSSDMPTLTASSMIYCTDCHDSDESPVIKGTGPRGPHGSIYSPLLRERYLTMDNTLESPAVYALCYRCHNRASILNNDSFQKNLSGRGGHSGHIVGNASGTPVNAPCSVCHDPHGVRDDSMASGSHTHLINFDTRYVSALAAKGYSYPIFTDNGTPRSGSCTLVCHGISHDGSSKYSYSSGGAIQLQWKTDRPRK